MRVPSFTIKSLNQNPDLLRPAAKPVIGVLGAKRPHRVIQTRLRAFCPCGLDHGLLARPRDERGLDRGSYSGCTPILPGTTYHSGPP